MKETGIPKISTNQNRQARVASAKKMVRKKKKDGKVSPTPTPKVTRSTKRQNDAANDEPKSKKTKDSVKNPASKIFQETVGNNAIEVTCVPSTSGTAKIMTKSGEMLMKKSSVEPKTPRIPPITISGKSREDIFKLMTELKVKNFTIRNCTHVIQLFCGTINDFDNVKKFLGQKDVNYFSHDAPNIKSYCVVLKGLHLVEADELKEELIAQQLKPLDRELKAPILNPQEIKPLIPRNARYAKHANYLVKFAPGEIKLAHLMQIRHLLHTEVRWETYKKRKAGPIHCIRCQRPGHGARNCHMPPRCDYCAGTHVTEDCPTRTEVRQELQGASTSLALTEGITAHIPSKCCNCNVEGHFASDSKCPKKIKYAEARKISSNKSRTSAKKHVPIIDFESFPPLQSKRTEKPPITPVYTRASYAEQTKLHAAGKPSNYSQNSCPSGTFVKNDNPFTAEEIISLTSDILSQLHNVKNASREEVIHAIMSISIKYLYHDV